MTTSFVVFSSVAFWTDAAHAKMSQTIPVISSTLSAKMVSQTDSALLKLCPPVLGDVPPSSNNLVYQGGAFAGIEINQSNVRCHFPIHLNNLEQRKLKNRGLHKECLSKAKNMPRINSRRGVDPPFGSFFLAGWGYTKGYHWDIPKIQYQ